MLPSHNEDCAEKVLWQGELHHGGVNLPCKLIQSGDPRLATNWPAKLCINKLANEQAEALVQLANFVPGSPDFLIRMQVVFTDSWLASSDKLIKQYFNCFANSI